MDLEVWGGSLPEFMYCGLFLIVSRYKWLPGCYFGFKLGQSSIVKLTWLHVIVG